MVNEKDHSNEAKLDVLGHIELINICKTWVIGLGKGCTNMKFS